MTELEFELRVYRTRTPGGNRECISTRNVPHAMQVWHESMDAYSRSLELVISGAWLMQLLDYSELTDETKKGTLDECERIKVASLCIQALNTNDEQRKQRCIEQVLLALGYDPDTLKK
jgi:hypothetical protein